MAAHPGARPEIRTYWPLQQMPGFSADTLLEADLNAMIAYPRDAAQRQDGVSGQR
jgi:mono/diheme cytochrome c family protein